MRGTMREGPIPFILSSMFLPFSFSFFFLSKFCRRSRKLKLLTSHSGGAYCPSKRLSIRLVIIRVETPDQILRDVYRVPRSVDR